MKDIEATGPDECMLEVLTDAFADRVQLTIIDGTDHEFRVVLTIPRADLEQLLTAVRSEAGEPEGDDQ